MSMDSVATLFFGFAWNTHIARPLLKEEVSMETIYLMKKGVSGLTEETLPAKGSKEEEDLIKSLWWKHLYHGRDWSEHAIAVKSSIIEADHMESRLVDPSNLHDYSYCEEGLLEVCHVLELPRPGKMGWWLVSGMD